MNHAIEFIGKRAISESENKKKENMNCLICKAGTYEPGMVTVKIERGSSIVLIKEVPAEVCDVCGNYLVDQKTTQEILEIANNAFDNGTELKVRKLIAA